jgi:hypothetical protein
MELRQVVLADHLVGAALHTDRDLALAPASPLERAAEDRAPDAGDDGRAKAGAAGPGGEPNAVTLDAKKNGS